MSASRVDPVATWASQQALSALTSKSETVQVINELRTTSSAFRNEQYSKYSGFYDRVEKQIRAETRSVQDVLGKNVTSSILSLVEKADVFDSQSVNVFLKTPAFEEVIGNVIYEAIFSFLEKVDILGSIVNTLPIIGPMRKSINEQLKKSLDLTLGKQIKAFLVDYNRIAIQRIIDFVLSRENKVKFQKANKSLVSSLLARSAASYLPSAADTLKIKEKAWQFVIDGIGEPETAALLDRLYAEFGDERLGAFVDLDAVLSQSPTLRELMERNLERLIASEEGKRLVQTL